MKLQKNQKRIFVLLGIVVLYAIYDFTINAEQYSSYYFSVDTLKYTKSTYKKFKNFQNNKKVTDQNIYWKRDPFFQFAVKKPNTVKKEHTYKIQLELKAITLDGENSFVMINDDILMEGESIKGYLIDKISKNKVKLSKAGDTHYIYLNSK